MTRERHFALLHTYPHIFKMYVSKHYNAGHQPRDAPFVNLIHGSVLSRLEESDLYEVKFIRYRS